MFFLIPGSFVLIEVGELQSVTNVYIFVASTSESCFTWVTTIQQAKVQTSLGVLHWLQWFYCLRSCFQIFVHTFQL